LALGDVPGHRRQNLRVHTEAEVALKSLSAELEHHPPILRVGAVFGEYLVVVKAKVVVAAP
jgi:hypothetical protein